MPDPHLVQVEFELIRKSKTGHGWHIQKGDIKAFLTKTQIYDRTIDEYEQFQTVTPHIPVWLARKLKLI